MSDRAVKFDLPTLVDAICEAYEFAMPGGKWAPRYHDRWYTFCNEGVNYIAKKMGYHGFDKTGTPNPDDAILANQQYEKMCTEKDEWHPTDDGDAAQLLANQGALVIAAWKNPTPGAPGHVCVLRPGNAEYSGTWKSVAPKCMNIGKDVFIGKKSSWAFRSSPRFFVWKGVFSGRKERA